MSPRANVRSLDAIRYFRPALVRFEDEAASAVSAIRQELNRTLDWLDHDCPAYWQQQARRAFDEVAQARSQLMRRKIITVAGHRPDCIEEEKELRKAQRRLETVQQKIQTVRQWSIKAHRAADEHAGDVGQFERALAHDVPQMLALLDRIITALEAYATASRPSPDAENEEERAVKNEE